MHILYFHQHFKLPTQAGGTRSYEFAQRLIQSGHSVTMVAGGAKSFGLSASSKKNIFRGNIDGIDVIQIVVPYSNKDGLAKRTVEFIRYACTGVRIAMKEQYDLLFATSTPLTAGIPGIIAKIFRKKKFVFEVRDLWPALPIALGMKNRFLIWCMSVLEKKSYHYADACIGLSPGICDGIKRHCQQDKPISMIPNGCDLKLFKPGHRSELILAGINDNDVVAVFTGAHGKANGLNSILDAAQVLKDKGRSDIKLVFIGDGNVKQSVVDRATKEDLSNCLFFDPMPKNELNRIVSSADIGMMVLANIPAFYYGTSPNKFFDYISSGLPVINNYSGWLADMITANECGIVVEPNNPVAFADGLIKLANNPELRSQYGNNSRQLAEKEFDRDKLGCSFVKCLENVSTV